LCGEKKAKAAKPTGSTFAIARVTWEQIANVLRLSLKSNYKLLTRDDPLKLRLGQISLSRHRRELKPRNVKKKETKIAYDNFSNF
jgi:hypothetical protein